MSEHTGMTRRHLLQGAVAASAASLLRPLAAHAADGKAVSKGRIKQSMAFWCFNAAGDKWDIEKMCQVAKELSCPSIELADRLAAEALCRELSKLSDAELRDRGLFRATLAYDVHARIAERRAG